MEHVLKIEVTVDGDTARLYEYLSDAADAVTPAQLNKAILETGIVHHSLMLAAIGLIGENDQADVSAIIDRIGEHTIMRDTFEQARSHWQGWSNTDAIEPGKIDDDTPK
jgi:hypothetical protein